MAKKAEKKNNERKINLLLGIILIILALIGIEKILTLLLIILGIYFLYRGARRD